MAERKKFIVTSQENLAPSNDVKEVKMAPVTIEVSAAMEDHGSRFKAERARMDSMSSTDDEMDPSAKVLDDSSYVDSITSTSSTASAKPLLSSVKELEEVTEDELEDRLARTNTMKGILENPAYVDSLTISSRDHRRLARACKKALALRQKQKEQGPSGKKSVDKVFSDKHSDVEVLETIPETGQWKYVKNVALLSIGTMLSYTAFLSLRNLQSSLNHQAGLGLISLAGGYGMFMLGSLISPFVVKALRPKRAILLAVIMQVVYVITNIFPSLYTLLPCTMAVGMCNAFLWVAVNTYLTYLSADYSKQSGKSLGTVMSKFFGIYFMIYQLNNIFGNLLSSVILFSGQGWKEFSSGGMGNGTFVYNSSSSHNHSISSYELEDSSIYLANSQHVVSNSSYYYNDTSFFVFDPLAHCGANHCHSFPIDQASGNKVTDKLRYILMGAFGAFAIFGFITILVFVEALKMYKTKIQCAQALKEIKSVFSLIVERKFLLLLPLQVYMGLEMSFLPGDVLKAFVTCPVGIEMVGYVMMSYGASTAFSSYVSGRLHKICGRLTLICTAGLINLIIFITLYFLETREGEYLSILLLVASWGIADGIWNTQVNSCIATMFVKKSEQALAGNRFVSGFGVTLAYAYAPFFCMKVKLAFTASLCVLGVFCFLILDRMQARSLKKFKVTQV